MWNGAKGKQSFIQLFNIKSCPLSNPSFGSNQFVPNFIYRCLEETNWNFERAGYIFTELHKQNKIPPEAFEK